METMCSLKMNKVIENRQRLQNKTEDFKNLQNSKSLAEAVVLLTILTILRFVNFAPKFFNVELKLSVTRK